MLPCATNLVQVVPRVLVVVQYKGRWTIRLCSLCRTASNLNSSVGLNSAIRAEAIAIFSVDLQTHLQLYVALMCGVRVHSLIYRKWNFHGWTTRNSSESWHESSLTRLATIVKPWSTSHREKAAIFTDTVASLHHGSHFPPAALFIARHLRNLNLETAEDTWNYIFSFLHLLHRSTAPPEHAPSHHLLRNTLLSCAAIGLCWNTP